MIYGVAVFAALVGAAIGWFGGDFLASYVRGWITPPTFDLAGQTWRNAGLREFCAFAAMVLGALLALRFQGKFRQRHTLWPRTLFVTVLSGGLIYAVLTGGNALTNALGVNPLVPRMEFQIRLPPGAALPKAREDIQVELRTDRNETLIEIIPALSSDRQTLSGDVPLVFRTAQRSIVMSLRGEPARIFRLRLPANPPASPEFGPWQQVDFLAEAGRETQRADITADYAIRYRVR
jgi:hypothetical protein